MWNLRTGISKSRAARRVALATCGLVTAAVLAPLIAPSSAAPAAAGEAAVNSPASPIRLLDNPLPVYQGGGLEGADPIQTGCSRDAYTVDSEPITVNSPNHYGAVIGHIDLRYSPSCQTNWARVVLQSVNGIAVASLYWPAVARIEGGNNHTYHYWVWQPQVTASSGVIWTNMVYSPTMWHPPGTDAPNCAQAEFAIVLWGPYNNVDLGYFEQRGWLTDGYAYGNTGCF